MNEGNLGDVRYETMVIIFPFFFFLFNISLMLPFFFLFFT